MRTYIDEDGEDVDGDWVQERIEKQYFIDRKGICHKWKGTAKESKEYTSLHYGIAEQLFPDMDYPDDYLMKEGWVMMGSSCYTQPVMHCMPTQAQIDTLFDLGRLDRLGILHDGWYLSMKDYEIATAKNF